MHKRSEWIGINGSIPPDAALNPKFTDLPVKLRNGSLARLVPLGIFKIPNAFFYLKKKKRNHSGRQDNLL